MRVKFFILIFLLFQIKYVFAIEDKIEVKDINLQGQLPRIEFQSTKFNFGNIYRGSIVTHAFFFQNTGNGVLILNSLHAACGCLNTKILDSDGKNIKNIFQPGEKGLLSVEFNSSNFLGNVSRSITVETNMGSSYPTITLLLFANILQELSPNPPLLYIGRIDKKIDRIFEIYINKLGRAKTILPKIPKSLIDQLEKSPNLLSFKDKIFNNLDPLQIYAVESQIPSISAKLINNIDNNIDKIKVTIKNDIPIGPLNTNLIIWNNSTFYKNLQIPIIGEIVGQVNYSSKYVEFGVVNEKNAFSERIITYYSNAKNFEINSIKIDFKKSSVLKRLKNSDIFLIEKEIIKYNDSDKYNLIKIHFKLLYPKRYNLLESKNNKFAINLAGNFIIRTNDVDTKDIIVPFFGVLKK